MAQNMKRGRNQRRRQGTNVNRAMDSTGPEVKIRGTALQIHDKYQALARDAASAGDRVRAESLLQHAEHYFRVMRAMQPQSDPSSEPQPSVNDEDGGNQNQGGRNKGKGDKKRDRDDSNAAQDDNEKSSNESDNQTSQEERPAAKGEGGDDSASDDETNEKPRRSRRKRPTRKVASEDDSSDDNEAGSEKSDKVPEAAE